MGSRRIALHLTTGLRVRVFGVVNGVDGKFNAQVRTLHVWCKVMALE